MLSGCRGGQMLGICAARAEAEPMKQESKSCAREQELRKSCARVEQELARKSWHARAPLLAGASRGAGAAEERRRKRITPHPYARPCLVQYHLLSHLQ